MKVKNRFLINYIVVFIITSVIAFLLLNILGIASARVEKTLLKNQYTAQKLMRDEIQEIDYEEIVRNNGGIQIISEDYAVIYSKGINTFPKKQLTVVEFTEFLVQSQAISRMFSYSIAYNEKMKFWLIVTFPTSLRIDFNVSHNQIYTSSDTGIVKRTLILFTSAYLIMLCLSTLIFSRLTARSITKPLEQLKAGAARLSGGDYSARVRLNRKNEIGELSNSFDLMADQIQNEITLREKSDSIRRQITLDIAHDLKNPLAVIAGYAEYCLKNPSKNNENYLNIINQKCSQVNGLINRLFELSKLESPEYKLNRKDCDFAEYIRTKCAEQIQNLEAAGFDYEFEVPEQEVYLKADLKEMDRVFDNLFENALRYNREGTKITLELKEFEGYVQIVIADNGIGIPQKYTENIFQPFIRTDEARSSETGGSGLGLAIIDKIVRLHQGEITLESDTGKGCIFRIRLPK